MSLSQYASDCFRCLENLDIAGIRKLWHEARPNMPQPETDRETLISMHMARTQMDEMPERKRFYSHRWLLTEGYPSALPDQLRPSAERVYPKVVEAVGVAVRSPNRRYAKEMEKTMLDAVKDAQAEGETDADFIKSRMLEARRKLLN